jgi:hypothetical protein
VELGLYMLVARFEVVVLLVALGTCEIRWARAVLALPCRSLRVLAASKRSSFDILDYFCPCLTL